MGVKRKVSEKESEGGRKGRDSAAPQRWRMTPFRAALDLMTTMEEASVTNKKIGLIEILCSRQSTGCVLISNRPFITLCPPYCTLFRLLSNKELVVIALQSMLSALSFSHENSFSVELLLFVFPLPPLCLHTCTHTHTHCSPLRTKH